MPTYSYACLDCTHRFDVRQSFTDDALTQCPECEGNLRKVFSGVGVVFKGSGFYRTDSRGGSAASVPSSSPSSSSTTSSSSSSSDSSASSSTGTSSTGTGSSGTSSSGTGGSGASGSGSSSTGGSSGTSSSAA